MRDLEELLSKLNPMAKEFVPSSLLAAHHCLHPAAAYARRYYPDNGGPSSCRSPRRTPDTVGKTGVQIHTDFGFLTVLHEDESVGGLEVADPEIGEFKPVDPLPGTFLINLGNVATAWSNGVLHNVRHRVQCVAAVPRVSVVLFLLAPKDDMVRAPEALVSTERPRRFKTFGYDDYRWLRQSTREHAEEALAQLAA